MKTSQPLSRHASSIDVKRLSLLLFLVLAVGCGGSGSPATSSGGTQNPAPTLSNISPNTRAAGAAALTIVASGSSFINSSVVQWNGVALATTYQSSTSLQAQVPASDLGAAGVASVTVETPAPGGGTSAAQSFTLSPAPNPAPSLASLSPSSVVAGSTAFNLTVNGSGFISASQVLWSGTARATTYVSATSLTAQILASDVSSPGSAGVSVENPAPGGGTSSALSFTINPPPNPAPSITSLSPISTVAGSPAFALTVNGTNFLSSSQVLWNGSQRSTTYVSPTSLTAQIAASDVASSGNASVSVQNPTPGGGVSAAVTFAINPANANLTATNLTVLNLAGNDLAWDPSRQKIYVSVSGDSASNANTVAVVDPIAGSVVSAQSLSSTPYGLALSDDDQLLYTAIDGGSMIQRLLLPALTPDIQWSLGTDPNSNVANYSGGFQVQPGAAHTLAVASAGESTTNIVIFDDGVARPAVAQGTNSIQWKADGSQLYTSLEGFEDAPFYITGTDTGVYTFAVNATGVSKVNTYGRVFRRGGWHLHYDATTGYLYTDWGEVVNPANGVPIGNYRFNRPSSTFQPGPLAVLDPALHRYYLILEVSEPDNTLAYQIQAYDQTDYHLLSTIVVPSATGQLQNFIRWGQSGLAFVSDYGTGGAPGMLYLLDGAFVNPSGVQDTTAGTPLNPVPILTGLIPLTATIGSGTATLTVTGQDFSGQPVVYWNGNPLETTFSSDTHLQAQIPAANLATAGQATITVSNVASVIPASNPLTFSVNPAPPAGNQLAVYFTGGNDLVWDANAKKIYVSMPGVQGDLGDSIAIVDPVSGVVTNPGFMGSDPANLSIASDGASLYAAFYGENAIRQLALPGFKVSNAWNLGADSFEGPYYALSLQAAPGAPQTTAATLAGFDISPSPLSVVIYDGSTPRPTQLPVLSDPYSSLQWGATDTTLYAVDQESPQSFDVLGVTPSGLAVNQTYAGILGPYSGNIHYDAGSGLIYSDGGQVIQPSNGSIAGNYGSSGLVIPDSALNTVFILGQTTAQTGTPSYTIESFDQAKTTPIGSIAVDNVVGTPSAFIRWGTNGLAFTTRMGAPSDFFGIGPGQLYVLSGTFVNPAGSPGGNPVGSADAAPSLPPLQDPGRVGKVP
jgi:hypothetical protein